jgi:hypothetical protein
MANNRAYLKCACGEVCDKPFLRAPAGGSPLWYLNLNMGSAEAIDAFLDEHALCWEHPWTTAPVGWSIEYENPAPPRWESVRALIEAA